MMHPTPSCLFLLFVALVAAVESVHGGSSSADPASSNEAAIQIMRPRRLGMMSRQLQDSTDSIGYAVDTGPPFPLYKVDLDNGAASYINDVTGLVDSGSLTIEGLTYCPIDQQLYGIAADRGPDRDPPQLFTLNTTTAEATFIASFTGLRIPGFLATTSLPGDTVCQFQAAEINDGILYSFNTDGQATLVGANAPANTYGGDFDCNGELLWTTADPDCGFENAIFTTNVTLDTTENVGRTGILSSSLAFDCCNNELYTFEDNAALGLYSVNKTTGSATQVGTGSGIGGGIDIRAFAIVPACSPTPAPTTLPPTPSPTTLPPTPAPTTLPPTPSPTTLPPTPSPTTLPPTPSPTTLPPTPSPTTLPPTPSPTRSPTDDDGNKCYYIDTHASHASNKIQDSSEFLAGGTEFHLGDICKDSSYKIEVCCNIDENYRQQYSAESSAECVTCDECATDQVVNDACCAWAWWDEGKYNHGHGDDRRHLNGIYFGGCIDKYGDESQCCKCTGFYKCIEPNDNCEDECTKGPDGY